MIARLLLKDSLILRLLGALITPLILNLYLTPRYIKYLSKWQPNQPIREHVPDRHLSKKGTPTSGGVIILITYILSSLLWVLWDNPLLWTVLFATIFFGGIGLLDDIHKIRHTNHGGLSARYKYTLQSIGGLILAIIIYKLNPIASVYTIGPIALPKWFLIPWAYWVIVASSNAFNLTDGLDGLAISQTLIIAFALLVLSLKKDISYIPNIEEIAVVCSILLGSSLGFLWYNIYPARIFMGDTGALALGALLGTLALILHQELTFAAMSLIPVIETASVILQVFYFKATKKRLFRMAPFHHHFELLGMSEPKIVRYFAFITAIMVASCLFLVFTHDAKFFI